MTVEAKGRMTMTLTSYGDEPAVGLDVPFKATVKKKA